MARALEGYRTLLDRIERVELVVAISMMATMVGCIFAQVVSRYVFGRPLVWVEELSTYAFIWGTFVGASLGLKRARHIKIQSFLGRLAPGPRRLILFATHAVIGVFCVVLVVNGVKAMLIFEWRQRTIALPIELPRYLFYSTPLILGTVSMTFTVVYELMSLAAGHRLEDTRAPL